MRTVLCAVNAKYIHTNLALRYLKAYLSRHEGMETILREYSTNDLTERIVDDLYLERADLIAFSCYIWNVEACLRIAAALKALQPGLRVVLGGPEVSYDPGSMMELHPCIDGIISGEGEESFRLLARALHSGTGPDVIPGLLWRRQEGFISAPRLETLDMESLPFPYEMGELTEMRSRIAYYESSRGCPYACSYCLSANERKMRFLSLERVQSDLDILLRHPLREIKFVDRCFNADERRSRAIMEYILQSACDTPVHLEINADLLSDEMLDFLTRVPSGRFNFEIGVQSIKTEVLAAVNRHCNLDRLQIAIDRLVEAGNIHIHLDLLAGLPGEDLERFAESFDWVCRRRPDHIQLGFLKMLKGAPIRSVSGLHGYVCQDYPPYEVLSNHYLSHDEMIVLKDIQQVLDRLYNSHLLERTLSYIMDTAYRGRFFAFYRDMAGFWRRSGSLHSGCRREEYYGLVLRFVRDHYPEHLEPVSEWARFDFMCNHCSFNLPGEMTGCNPGENNRQMLEQWEDDPSLQAMAENIGFRGIKEARNHLHVQYFRLDPRTGRGVEQVMPVVFAYERHTRRFVDCIYPDQERSF